MERVIPDAPEPLTAAQTRLVMDAFKTWIACKCRHESFFRSYITGEGFKPEYLAQKLSVDLDHSSLWRRLLSGKPALPEPPPLQNAYPVYPDDAA